MNRQKRELPINIFIIIVFLLSILLFTMSYNFDNKYTHNSPQAKNGLLIFSEEEIEKYGYTFLVEDWEIYRDQIISPKDFKEKLYIPDEYVFIGQYNGFEKSAVTPGNPHGSATYRMNIVLPPNRDNYTLELPEIFSSYRLYVNGELVKQIGNPNVDEYKSETKITKYVINGLDKLEIIIQVSDFDHFYSGFIFPPAFGQSNFVDRVLSIRLSIRFATIILTISIGIFNFLIYRLFKKTYKSNSILLLYVSILCLWFTVYIAFPVIKSLWSISTKWYALEIIAFPIFISVIIAIQSKIFDLENSIVKLVKAFGIFTIICSGSLYFLIAGNLNVMLFYSFFIQLFMWVATIFLIATSIWSAYNGHIHSKPMLLGAIIFGTSLIADRLFPLFEPIYSGWFFEISGTIYVVLINSIFLIEINNELRFRIKLEEGMRNVSSILEVQKTYYPLLLDKEEELRRSNHDFRHHLSIIHELVKTNNTKKLREYVNSISETLSSSTQISYCDNFIIDMILRLYAKQTEYYNINLKVNVSVPKIIPIEDVDLSIIINNILENAIEASLKLPKEQRNIEIDIICKANHLGINVRNAFDGVLKNMDGRFLSSKEYGRVGIGLSSVISISKLYNGHAKFYPSEDNYFHSEVLLSLRERSSENENSNL